MKFIFISLIFAGLNVSAQKISWDEAIKLAQQNNLELQIAQSNLNAADDATTTAQSGFYPHIYASASGTQSSLNDAVTNSYSAQIGFNQNLFAGFSDFFKSKQSDINFKIAQVNLQIAKAQLSSDLKQAYESLLYIQSYVLLTQDIVRRRENDLQNVQLRFNSGRENKGSVLLSQAYYSQAQYENLQASHQLTTYQENLGRILGIADYNNLQITDNRTVRLNQTIQKLEDARFSDLALKTPEYQLAQLQERSANADWDLAHAGFYPSLDLTGSYGKLDSVFFPELNERWNLGLTLTIPLFDGGRDYAASKSAASRYNAALKNAESSFKQLKIRVRTAYSNYIEAVEKAKVDAVFRNAAEVRADIARNKYNNGLMTFDDWDVVENDLISRQKASLISARESVFSEANWEQIQGIGVIQ